MCLLSLRWKLMLRMKANLHIGPVCSIQPNPNHDITDMDPTQPTDYYRYSKRKPCWKTLKMPHIMKPRPLQKVAGCTQSVWITDPGKQPFSAGQKLMSTAFHPNILPNVTERRSNPAEPTYKTLDELTGIRMLDSQYSRSVVVSKLFRIHDSGQCCGGEPPVCTNR